MPEQEPEAAPAVAGGPPRPPLPPVRRPTVIETHGDRRVDDWAWLRDREDPAVLAHLEAENAYTEAALAHLRPLRDQLYAEFRTRVQETDQSVPVAHGPWWYVTRTIEGAAYPVFCRLPRASATEQTPGTGPSSVGDGRTDQTPPEIGPAPLPGEQVLLDHNALAEGHEFCALGTVEVSPDHTWLAYSVDTSGDERFALRFWFIGAPGGAAPQAGAPGGAAQVGAPGGAAPQAGAPGGATPGGEAPEVIEGTYYGGAWGDDQTFFYTTVDQAMRPYRVWRHRLGTDPAGDELVLEEADQRFHVSVSRTTDGALVVMDLRSAVTAEAWVVPASDPWLPARCVDPRRQGVEYAVEHLGGGQAGAGGGGWLVALTNDGAEDFRVVAAPDDRLPVAGWREVVPHRPGTRVGDVAVLAGGLVLAERLDAEPRLRVVPWSSPADGEPAGEAPKPAGARPAEDGDRNPRRPEWPFGVNPLAGSWLVPADEHPAVTHLGPNPEVGSPLLRYEQTSLATPRTVLELSIGAAADQRAAAAGAADGAGASGAGERRPVMRKRQPVGGGFNPSQYRTTRLWAPAEGGASVPISLVWSTAALGAGTPERALPEAPAPCLLYGYGAYEHSVDPTFSALRLSLLDRGVVYAVAHVRGGGELGRRWYEDGKLAAKPNTFTDFVACARHLVAEGVTTPDRLAARGASAGGLLMGAVANLAPELFRAIVAEVPFVDALTTILDETLPLSVIEWEEWGNPGADPDIYAVMRGYAPYDNVVATDGVGRPVRYPDILATAGLEDSRVGYWEPAKWVARLRAANPENRVLLRTELSAGHGGPSGRYEAWREEALVHAFVLDALGVAGG